MTTEPRCRCWRPYEPQVDCPTHRAEVVGLPSFGQQVAAKGGQLSDHVKELIRRGGGTESAARPIRPSVLTRDV